MSSDGKGVSERRIYWTANLCIFLLGLLSLTVLRIAEVDPSAESLSVAGRRIPSMCMYRKVLGRPCPGCGLTRSMALYLHGQPGAARQVHPGGPWTLLWAAAQLVVRAAMLWFRPYPGPALLAADVAVFCLSMLAAAYLPLMAGT